MLMTTYNIIIYQDNNLKFIKMTDIISNVPTKEKYNDYDDDNSEEYAVCSVRGAFRPSLTKRSLISMHIFWNQ